MSDTGCFEITAYQIYLEMIELQFTGPVIFFQNEIQLKLIDNYQKTFELQLPYSEIINARHFETFVVNRYFGLVFDITRSLALQILSRRIGGYINAGTTRKHMGNGPQQIVIYTSYCMIKHREFIQKFLASWNRIYRNSILHMSCSVFPNADENIRNGLEIEKIPIAEFKAMPKKPRYLIGINEEDGSVQFTLTNQSDPDLVLDLKIKSKNRLKTKNLFSLDIYDFLEHLDHLFCNIGGVILPLNFGSKLINVLDKINDHLFDFSRLFMTYYSTLIQNLTDNKYLNANLLIIPIPIGTKITLMVWFHPKQPFIENSDDKESKILFINPKSSIGPSEQISFNKLHLAITLFFRTALEDTDLQLSKITKWIGAGQCFEPIFHKHFDECFNVIVAKIRMFIKNEMEDNFGLDYIDEPSDNLHFSEEKAEVAVHIPSFQ